MSNLQNNNDAEENEKILYITESSAKLIRDVFQLLNTVEVKGMPNVVTLGLTLQQFDKIFSGISEIESKENISMNNKKNSGLLK